MQHACSGDARPPLRAASHVCLQATQRTPCRSRCAQTWTGASRSKSATARPRPRPSERAPGRASLSAAPSLPARHRVDPFPSSFAPCPHEPPCLPKPPSPPWPGERGAWRSPRQWRAGRSQKGRALCCSPAAELSCAPPSSTRAAAHRRFLSYGTRPQAWQCGPLGARIAAQRRAASSLFSGVRRAWFPGQRSRHRGVAQGHG